MPSPTLPKLREMVKTKAGEGRMCAQSTAQVTAVGWKQKKAASGDEKKRREANETMGKWFPSATCEEDLEQMVAEKSMAAALVQRLPRDEVPPKPALASTCSIRSSLAGGLDSRCTGSCVGCCSFSAVSCII